MEIFIVKRNKDLQLMTILRMLSGLLLLTYSILTAAVPSEDLSPNSFALEYEGTLRGENIPDHYFPAQDVASHESIQMLYLRYAPVTYAVFSIGLGAERFIVEPYAGSAFNGRYNFSPAGEVALFTPYFAGGVLRVTGGAAASYLYSEDTYNTVYRGLIANPFAGIVFSLGNSIDVALGCRAHRIFGTIEDPTAGTTTDFHNRTMVRGYGTLVLHSPSDGAYASFDADVSPKYSTTWNGGPLEATVRASIGYIVRKAVYRKPIAVDNTYFPGYQDMMKLEDTMSKEIE
jgi:hypothetical protein